ncbi:MAG: type IV pilus modification PilV family protein [Gemmatimonas sp.]
MRHTTHARRARIQNSPLHRHAVRRGFTLVEILVAIVILAAVVLGMAMSTTTASRSIANSGTRSIAQAMVDQQIARARAWPTYASLSQLSQARFNPSANGLTSTTAVSRDTLQNKNLTTITVTVTGSGAASLSSPIVRSISIAAP